MQRMIWLSIVVIGFLTSVARATPPQVVSVDDLLFGMTDTHLFLLRRLEDNMGFHGVTQTDVLLVARNRATNADEDIWPVARSLHRAEEGAVETLAIAGAVNPFEIAQARGARLLLGWSGQPIRAAEVAVTWGETALVLADGRSAATFRLGYEEMSARLEEGLEQTRDRLPPYFTEGGGDVLRGVRFDPAVDCEVAGFVEMAAAVWLARVSCENDETMAPVSTYMVVHPET
jgi:hypothetical protein